MRDATLHAAAPRRTMTALSHRVSIPEHGVCEGVDAGGFSGPGRSADDEVRHVALFRDDLEPVQRLLVSHHLVVIDQRNRSALCSSIPGRLQVRVVSSTGVHERWPAIHSIKQSCYCWLWLLSLLLLVVVVMVTLSAHHTVLYFYPTRPPSHPTPVRVLTGYSSHERRHKFRSLKLRRRSYRYSYHKTIATKRR